MLDKKCLVENSVNLYFDCMIYLLTNKHCKKISYILKICLIGYTSQYVFPNWAINTTQLFKHSAKSPLGIMRYAWWNLAYCIMWCPRNYFWLFQMPKTPLKSAQILEFPQPNFEWTREKRCRYLEISKINRKELFFEFLKKNEVSL